MSQGPVPYDVEFFTVQDRQGLGSLDEVVQLEAASGGERAPQGARKMEQKRLHHEDNGHPLVVRDHISPLVASWDVLLVGKIVGISDPAVVLGILFMVVRKVGRDPTNDRFAVHKLHVAHNDAQNDQDGHRQPVIEPIDDIIVVPRRPDLGGRKQVQKPHRWCVHANFVTKLPDSTAF